MVPHSSTCETQMCVMHTPFQLPQCARPPREQQRHVSALRVKSGSMLLEALPKQCLPPTRCALPPRPQPPPCSPGLTRKGDMAISASSSAATVARPRPVRSSSDRLEVSSSSCTHAHVCRCMHA